MTDEQVLCEAMGKLTYHCGNLDFECFSDVNLTCQNCDYYTPDEAQFPSTPDILWRVLQYMMGREDWRNFHNQMWDEYVADDRTWSVSGFFPWFLTPAPDGKVRLVSLAARWCRENGGGSEKAITR